MERVRRNGARKVARRAIDLKLFFGGGKIRMKSKSITMASSSPATKCSVSTFLIHDQPRKTGTKSYRPSAWCIGHKNLKPKIFWKRKIFWIKKGLVYSPKEPSNKAFNLTSLGRPGICLRKSRAGKATDFGLPAETLRPRLQVNASLYGRKEKY